jgi:hypothetical protein
MRRFFITTALSASLLIVPSAAVAGPDEIMRDSARAEAAKLRSEGWPRDRCYVGVNLFNNTVIAGNGKLLPNDKLLFINATNVEKDTTDELGKVLNSLPPNIPITVQVRRGREIVNVEQPCGNGADYERPYLKALDLAGEKKWYDCVDALAGKPDDALYLNLRARCARVSRKASEYPVQQWVDTTARHAVAMGAFAQDNWKRVATALLKARMDVSPSIYESLVADVKAWDGGKTWDTVQPDLAAMREAAERGVKNRLIDPQSAIIEMPYDFIYGTWTPAFTGTSFEGYMTCGTVNAKNRMGGYTGSTFFISVVDETGFEKYTDMDSATLEYIRPVDNACAQLTPKLKLVGPVDRAQSSAETPQILKPSMAQELEKLAELHSKGTLSDLEYAAAKARVISGN